MPLEGALGNVPKFECGQRCVNIAIDLCIGVCTGEAVVGNIGSDNTRSCTVSVDTVNLTARLERANRVYGTQILQSVVTKAPGFQYCPFCLTLL